MKADKGRAGTLAKTLKIILGLVFIVSALLKIIDMDKFEIYVYSYHFFSLNFSFLVARAAIIVELVLGIGLVSNCFHKLMWWGSVLMLIGYTALLVYALVLGRTDNCHCFGDYLQFNPWQSILKNGLLLALFALIYNVKGWHFRYQWIALVVMAVGCCVAVFLVSPPDNFTSSYNASNDLQVELFKEALQDPPLDSLPLQDGKKVVGIFSSGCQYCQMTAQKLSLMQSYYGFPEEDVYYVFMGSEEGVQRFFDESESTRYQYVIYDDVIRLLKINNGVFPILVMMDDGEVIHQYGFRNMREDEVKTFFLGN
ncbi:MAG: hypothetical protein IKT08_02615 [Bacteroidales bacterium]|nr:hypothetical protein [Bacteroidales bacterium]